MPRHHMNASPSTIGTVGHVPPSQRLMTRNNYESKELWKSSCAVARKLVHSIQTGITAPDRAAAESAVVRSQLVRFTAFGNVLGAPYVNIPADLSNDGLPVGLQVVGRPHDDGRLLSIARAVEELMPAPRWAEAISRAAISS